MTQTCKACQSGVIANTNTSHGGVKFKKGWKFATAEECEYPAKMCQAMAQRAASFVGVTPVGTLERVKTRTKPSMETLEQRAAVGRQSKSKVVKPLVPEHKQVKEILVTDPQEIKTVESMSTRLDATVQLAGHITSRYESNCTNRGTNGGKRRVRP